MYITQRKSQGGGPEVGTDSRLRKGYLAYVLWGNFISIPMGECLYLSVPLVVSARKLENYLGEFHFFGSVEQPIC